jgi:hypothetical protein
LGDFLPLGRFFASWAIFRLLGDFSPLGRFFASWAIVYFDQFFIEKSRLNFGLLIPWKKICKSFDEKMGWATFWVIDSN